MPFNILGKIKVDVDVDTRKQIGGQVKLIVGIKKNNLNNAFSWEVRAKTYTTSQCELTAWSVVQRDTGCYLLLGSVFT